jgi:7-alpha-hydroxysteroid dehydrogenase
MNQMTRILGCEFAPKVRVNGIVVGYVRTEGNAVVNDDQMNKAASETIPMGRGGYPEDIAAGVLYLASPASEWMTGEMIEITGGAHEPPMKYPTDKL